ncbi:conserved hypothetical protein [Cellulomonas flavigena DSM 20109]|uniref:Uncharacterized protein n=1 Tax=Cellulomonas flavigena (strain ATCC 482 / DSM 20109 / BCRC 11376 / JCM 18109 / NBRC 3775 / NCIMB 8073 / NRS 134) TaxID=446466 RepID=D5UC00_CELFN|nr:DUF6361 family protein [Cellulomonas flavigena]ADG76159.1 conserved hypothetical protein [Cellulomonas flavigena DSM 20109]
MPSSFGWLDSDTEQRRRMLEVVDLFSQDGTVDELGTGAIRDALSHALFPGTSVVHTRLRYVLFVPWLLQRAADGSAGRDAAQHLRDLEVRLIGSLLAGGEPTGVIGSQAGARLRRMPSSVYWSALGAWGIRQPDLSVEGYLRRRHDLARLAARTAVSDDPEAREQAPGAGLDPHLPPPPADLLTRATFDLTPVEEEYLSDSIARATAGSLLAWLVHHPPPELATYVWEIATLGSLPADLAETVDHARRFHTAIHGAVLLYNLLLARRRSMDEAVAGYESDLALWRGELQSTGALDGWDRVAWWTTVIRLNPEIRPLTRVFVDQWLDLVTSDPDVASSTDAAHLVATRERQIKGGRARLANQAALDHWGGASGLRRLDFNWSVARTHLADLYAARGVA